jgi:hypothetical protein
MYNQLILFGAIILMINMSLIGIGVYDTTMASLNQYVTTDANIQTITNGTGDYNTTLVNVGSSNTVSTTTSQIAQVPEITTVYSQLLTIMKFANGWIFAWWCIFMVLGMPSVIMYGFIGIISIIEILAIAYLITSIIGAVFSGRTP